MLFCETTNNNDGVGEGDDRCIVPDERPSDEQAGSRRRRVDRRRRGRRAIEGEEPVFWTSTKIIVCANIRARYRYRGMTPIPGRWHRYILAGWQRYIRKVALG